jgi:hypothetical protein
MIPNRLVDPWMAPEDVRFPNMRVLFVTTPLFFRKLKSPAVAGMQALSSGSFVVAEAAGGSVHL